MKQFFLGCLIVILATTMVEAQSFNFQTPDPAIMALADVQLAPQVIPDRENKLLLMLSRSQYKTMEQLAEEELRLAGVRINPANFNSARTSYSTGITIQELATGKPLVITGLPSKVRLEYASISPENDYLAFLNVLPNGLELWVLDLKSGVARQLSKPNISAAIGSPISWGIGGKIYARWVEDKTQFSAGEKPLPTGPAVQEAVGKKAPARTFQDLLKNPIDEKKFDHYAGAEIVVFDVKSGNMNKVLPKGIYRSFSPSPDGKFLLVTTVKRPYSYNLPYSRFAYKVDVFNADGSSLANIVEKPLQENIPQGFDATEKGRNGIAWRFDKPATIFFSEPLDEGDPAKEVPKRDNLFTLDFPYNGIPKFLASTTNRYSSITWGNDQTAFIDDFKWKTRQTKTYKIDPSIENKEPNVVFDRSSEDLYSDPGDFVKTFNQYGKNVLKFGSNGQIFLIGEGCSPEGNKPFIDEMNTTTLSKKRLWQADGKSTYEEIYALLDENTGTLLTRIQAPKTYPNFFIRSFIPAKKSKTLSIPKQVTFLDNPYKALEKISKQKIYYKRDDGVELYSTLFLPPNYDKAKDGKLPVLMEAYPTEFKDAKAAGQVKESPHQFVAINWASPLFWTVRGYAVLEDTQFPIIGKGSDEPNDTYTTQLVANAAAAIKTIDSLGYGDPKRVAVMGHSYGAFMTANLLAHSRLFAGGIARSGAYNRSLTPFGFQSEERNYWEAQKVYNEMAPFNYADKIKDPLLFIHGDSDNNPGTFTLQSERMFQAIKGLGGVSRLVLLPYESHGYQARENILHMLWEMDSWLDKWVKNKK
jgi:dipeptidyl aminopeptidase/acylaminoacyl peptidase